MKIGQIYIFADGTPSDWLTMKDPQKWHTIAYFVCQSDPTGPLYSELVNRDNFNKVLLDDPHFHKLLNSFKRPSDGSFGLRKWKSSKAYRNWFLRQFCSMDLGFCPNLNAISFREQDLITSEALLLEMYNRTYVGRPFGFQNYEAKGIQRMKHAIFNRAEGLQIYDHPSSQMLVLLLMATVLGSQFIFYRNRLKEEFDFDVLNATIVSDELSGDNHVKKDAQKTLQFLTKNAFNELVVTRSSKTDFFPGDLLADNVAGLLNACISGEDAEAFESIRSLPSTSFLEGWKRLDLSEEGLELTTVLQSRQLSTI